MENKSHALVAGAFVLAMLGLVVALASWLTRDTRSLRVFELSSASAVNGLQPEATVRYKGVEVGKVTRIGFDPLAPGNVLVRIAIDEQATITQSTVATLGFQGVTGLAFVQLEDSGASKVMLAGTAQSPARIPLQPGFLANLSDKGTSLLSQLQENSARINLLLAPENQKDLMASVKALGQAASSIQQLSEQTQALLAAQLGPHGNTSLPRLISEANDTLKIVQATSLRVGDSADEARASAKSFKDVTQRMGQPGGTLDQLAMGVDTLATMAQTVNSVTLPRLNQAVDDAARTARALSRALDGVNDNPQSLVFGNSPAQPGPGEPGYVAPSTTP